ncbi:hypothetical protein [Gimesia fumaroli]|jgi:hypothetical protein|uniref:Uncharacterized protein n=1 Tax=Gimesia fumaroli TaxID=2527976 RepID=A0A518IEP1_9PLAN|nr:hypothetical protein [Gimesia fumaroli]QDV51571.1 hypothetical protein Enr17x_36270 [Gimesia fumaroli]
MKKLLVGIGAMIMMTIGLFQGPQVDSAEQVLAMSAKGAAACDHDGYTNIDCDIVPACTAGQSESAVSSAKGTAGSHKVVDGVHADGNCTGNAQCPAALSTDRLSTEGCGGGG